MPFYSDRPGAALRFGDVIQGFQHPTVRIDALDHEVDLKLSVSRPQYFAIMSPCCDIELSALSLAPLTPVRDNMVLNYPRLRQNLTQFNIKFPPKEGLTAEQIAKQSPEKQAELLAQGPTYSFLDCFVYEQNGLFPTYPVTRSSKVLATSEYRMVDFKSMFRIDCRLIERGKEVPQGLKVSELSEDTRAQLRDKLSYYFGRLPDV